MCDFLVASSFFTTRNGSVVWVTSGHGLKYNGLIIKATEGTRRSFPVGTKVVYQNDMGHVMCKGEEEEGKECVLHPLDAVNFLTWPENRKGPELTMVTKKVKEKFKDREVLVVTKESPKAVRKKPGVLKVGEEGLFRDLKAGQKYTYINSSSIYERNGLPLDKNPGPHNTTLNGPNGYGGWEMPNTRVVRVA